MFSRFATGLLGSWLIAASLCVPLEAGAVSAAGIEQILRSRLSEADPSAWTHARATDMLAPESLRSFYGQRDYSPVWSGAGGLRPRAEELLAVIRSATEHGLPPELYHERQIQRVIQSSDPPTTAERKADIELLFSDALFGYLDDLLKGRADDIALKDSSINAAEDLDVNALVGGALANGGLRQLVRRIAPAPAAYERLRDALGRLRRLAAEETPLQLPEGLLREGDTGGEIAALRRRLALLGDLPESENDGSGRFDVALAQAVERFQARHGLVMDGVVGPETRPALETPISHRVEQVVLNLERWRWLPRDPGDRYLLVNIAGQELDVIENDRRTLHMRVIVGKPFQRTPSFASKIETVVLNPYWEVPYSIAVKEILPTLRSDPGYLARENMQVFKRLESGEPVDPATIDWTEVSARNFPYRFRQKPGPDNALGLVKFLLPNKYSVYLHDTPAKTLFARSRRCFSHGCVRLEKPFELAELLLHDEPGWSSERMQKTLETEQNYRIRLTRPMPTYLAYWTAWVDNRGFMHFRDDVYGRDARLEAALDGADP